MGFRSALRCGASAAQQHLPAAGAICGVTAAGLVGIAGLGGVSCNALAGTGVAPVSSAGLALTGVANPVATQNDWGVAAQGGVKVNAPWIAPQDVLYLQATYERGALGYITGNTLAFLGGFWASSLNYGQGVGAVPAANGWNETFSDCVWTLSQQMRETTGRRSSGCL